MTATCPPAEPGPGCSLHGTPGRSQGKDRCLQPGLGAQHFHRSVGGGKPSSSRGGPPLREGTPTPAGRRPAASQTVGKSCSEDKAGSLSLSAGRWGLAPSVTITPITMYPQG